MNRTSSRQAADRLKRLLWSMQHSNLYRPRTLPRPQEDAPNATRIVPVATVPRYFAVGIANSAPLPVLSGQRCMIDFCLV